MQLCRFTQPAAMNPFSAHTAEIRRLVALWEPKLLALPTDVITTLKNLGHLCDSATNNTHRIVHLQYQPTPLQFPDYANFGNNDRWISIQDYQHEDWNNLIQLWKYANLHLVHVIRNVDLSKLDNQWISSETQLITLSENIEGYLPHFMLHLNEMEELMEE